MTRGALLLSEYLTGRDIKAFAKLVDVDNSYLHHLKAGRRVPSIPVAAKIQEATGNVVPVQAWAEP